MTTKLDLSGRRFFHNGEGPFTIAEVQEREAAHPVFVLSSRAYLSSGFDAVIDSFRPQMPDGFMFDMGPNVGALDGKSVLVYTNAESAELAAHIVDVLEETAS